VTELEKTAAGRQAVKAEVSGKNDCLLGECTTCLRGSTGFILRGLSLSSFVDHPFWHTEVLADAGVTVPAVVYLEASANTVAADEWEADLEVDKGDAFKVHSRLWVHAPNPCRAVSVNADSRGISAFFGAVVPCISIVKV